MIVLAKEDPAAEINEADPFKEVLEAIDKLISDLEAEEKVRPPHCALLCGVRLLELVLFSPLQAQHSPDQSGFPRLAMGKRETWSFGCC